MGILFIIFALLFIIAFHRNSVGISFFEYIFGKRHCIKCRNNFNISEGEEHSYCFGGDIFGEHFICNNCKKGGV